MRGTKLTQTERAQQRCVSNLPAESWRDLLPATLDLLDAIGPVRYGLWARFRWWLEPMA